MLVQDKTIYPFTCTLNPTTALLVVNRLRKAVKKKDLGVIISQDLKVSQQYTSAYSRASNDLG